MKMQTGLSIGQSQGLLMTPRLQQAMKLLQSSNIELSDYIEQQLMENPLLEWQEEIPEEREVSQDFSEEWPEGAEGSEDDSYQVSSLESPLQDLHTEDYLNTWDQGVNPSFDDEIPYVMSSAHGQNDDDGDLWKTNALSRLPSLKEHLHQQLHHQINHAIHLAIGDYLIDALDDAGYLNTPLEEIARDLQITLESAEEILYICQGFEPAGVFARSLSECLRLQIEELDALTPTMATLLGHLDWISGGDLQKITKKHHLDMEEVRECVALIRTLNPKPGLSFDRSRSEQVIPDVIMKRTNTPGEWLLEMNEAALPRILINSPYYHQLKKIVKEKEDTNYLKGHYQQAKWLMKTLQQRSETILRVSEEIVRRQFSFFKEGSEALTPMVMREVAEVIEVHESTVSRATLNKFIATPRGIFELKYFFSSSVNHSSHGEACSSKSIQTRIKALVAAEDQHAPLSDEQLVNALKREGIHIARRTITKYREALMIDSSVNRRRYYTARRG